MTAREAVALSLPRTERWHAESPLPGVVWTLVLEPIWLWAILIIMNDARGWRMSTKMHALLSLCVFQPNVGRAVRG